MIESSPEPPSTVIDEMVPPTDASIATESLPSPASIAMLLNADAGPQSSFPASAPEPATQVAVGTMFPGSSIASRPLMIETVIAFVSPGAAVYVSVLPTTVPDPASAVSANIKAATSAAATVQAWTERLTVPSPLEFCLLAMYCCARRP